ncbi:MAG: DUF3160 domain-containing protein [Lachnospiraceae bacterium]|nr:DUF3160 domain-containing protein [Lachnospiraceae bacterium]
MKKRILSLLLASALLLNLTGCGVLTMLRKAGNFDHESGDQADADDEEEEDLYSDPTAKPDEDEDNEPDQPSGNAVDLDSLTIHRPYLLGEEEDILYDENLIPSVPDYSVEKGLANVTYASRFDYLFDPSYEYFYDGNLELIKGLEEKGFAVTPTGYDEFFDVYEGNRYNQFPNFITVDSLMHTYHLYFAYLMKHTEKDYLADELLSLSRTMTEESAMQYEELKGTEWEDAALRNHAFFLIGQLLQDDGATSDVTDPRLPEIIKTETARIMDASGIETSMISNDYEDYSQYKPRGYYEGDDQLEKYFRAMMWYGRIPFELKEEDQLRSAALMISALKDSGISEWESIYSITSFFAGSSDDLIYNDLYPVMEKVYGEIPSASEAGKFAEDKDAFADFNASVQKMDPPAINSIPVWEGEDPVIPSFRFMGQRFTVDAAIMQKLIYSAVKENPSDEKRMLPDALDTAAALGSETAYEILKDQGATSFENYDRNLNLAKEHFDNSGPKIWNASLYAGWLNTLRPLFKEKGKGYPYFMQSKEWAKKDLETFAGSYAELKHDTILYAKQVMAEMGDGGDDEILDDRGYVDPEPVIYSRFANLALKTKTGLQSYSMLSSSAAEDLDKLNEMALTLLRISEKELKNETLSLDDYEFIRAYGGDIEHFWYEANQENMEDSLNYSYQAPCPIVADIATDPNGQVLEVGTGSAQTIYVVFPIDGELHIGSGSVYSFYQFIQPIDERMTDSEWRDRLSGGHLDDDWNWVPNEDQPVQPEWTQSYRTPKTW